MGTPLFAAIISTPENVRNREEIFAAQRKLADPRILKSANEAAPYAHQPAVLVIQCNIHSDEVASSQMAMELAYRLARNDTLRAELRTVDFPNPWKAGRWTLHDIVDYELIASEATVHLASTEREPYVRDFLTLGQREIAQGESDSGKAQEIPTAQRDPSAAIQRESALALGGVEMSVTDSSVIVPMAQSFRAHAKDLLEVQHYPKRLRWPGGPPEQPYDVTGWTLPLQMRVRVRALATMPKIIGRAEMMNTVTGNEKSSISASNTGAVAPVAKALALPRKVTISSGHSTSRKALFYALTRLPRIAIYRPWTGNMDEGWCR